jgi:hypothetical protein
VDRKSRSGATVCCHDAVAIKEGAQVMVADQAAGSDLDNWDFAGAN